MEAQVKIKPERQEEFAELLKKLPKEELQKVLDFVMYLYAKQHQYEEYKETQN